MHISTIKINDDMLLKNKVFKLKKGINFILGANGSGKSKILYSVLLNLEHDQLFKMSKLYSRMKTFESCLEIIYDEKHITFSKQDTVYDQKNDIHALNKQVALFNMDRSCFDRLINQYSEYNKEKYIEMMNLWLNAFEKYHDEISLVENQISFSHRIYDSEEDYFLLVFLTYLFEMNFISKTKILIIDDFFRFVSKKSLPEIFMVFTNLNDDLQIIATGHIIDKELLDGFTNCTIIEL